jgi:hypothetical protein
MRFQRIFTWIIFLCIAAGVAGCASLSGYPSDPVHSDAELAMYSAYENAAVEAYFRAQTESDRRRLRDRIVYTRLAAYDVEFQTFTEKLNKESGLGNLSGDFALLILNGIGATTGGAATKAAMNAASAGVTGARAAVDRDVFYNQALPAVQTQMSTSRNAQLVVIQEALRTQSDADYPLPRAVIDLNKYREAGSLPFAISALSINAGVQKGDVNEKLIKNTLGGASPAAERAFALNRGRGAATARPAGVPTDSAFYRNLP